MVDKFSKEIRSRIMSHIRGRDTQPELSIRKALYAHGRRYRKNYRIGRKTIDIAFVGPKIAVFVDGCFWHGCPSHGNRPKSNLRYWNAKINANVARDRTTNSELRSEGWKVIRVWEHRIKNQPEVVISRIEHILGQNQALHQ